MYKYDSQVGDQPQEESKQQFDFEFDPNAGEKSKFNDESLDQMSNFMRGSTMLFNTAGKEEVSLENFKLMKLLGKGA